MTKLSLASAKTHLPDVICDMADIIGFAATEQLVKALGGATFWFGKGRHDTPRLAMLCRAIGEPNAYQLIKTFGGEKIYIPRCDKALRRLRDARFKADFMLLKEDGISSIMAITELCPKYQISDRTAWEIIRRHEDPISQQRDLF